jgi:hypothetical protein
MIRIVARVLSAAPTGGDPAWFAIEGDTSHGYLIRAFADLSSKQLYDLWMQDRDVAFEYAETYGIDSSDWKPRSQPLPGSVPFPDLGIWTPDNAEFEQGPSQS